jgi:hypothetical protein
MKITAFCSLVVAAASVCLALPLAAQSSAVANRIAAPIDETNLVTLKGNVHPLAQARNDRGAAPAATPTGRIMLVLQRSASQQQALTQYLADVQNASSPNYHKWLTPAQYGAQFGISDSDLQTVQTWLQSHGFKIEKVPQARNIVLFSGDFGQIQSAFHTSIHALSVNGEKHFGNMSDPQIPAALAPVVAGVGPLNDFHPKPTLARGPTGRYNTSTHTIQPTLTLFQGTTPLLFVDPADAATIYDTPNTKLNANFKSGTTWDGTGVKIGIAGDSDVNTADVGNYRVAFLNQATTSSNIPIVVVDGDDPGFNGDEIEALLDNEVSGGLAPGASLYFYTSSNSDLASGLFNAIFRALDDNTVSILNISFGACEADEGPDGNLAILETAEQAAAQGISMTVSTGDSGSAGCDDDNTESAAVNGLAVNGLASTPYNIAVGGTDYDVLATAFTTYASDVNSGSPPYWGTALNYIPEEPWNDSTSVNTDIAANVALSNNGSTLIVADGGGSSIVYSKPAFQTSLTPNDNARDLPDVSFLAANGLYNATWVVCGDNQADGESATLTAYDCIESGGQFTDTSTFLGVGGTSAAAPAFAGILALVSQSQGGARLGQADSVLYQLAQSKYSSVFHDVTTGDNSVVCQASSPNCGSNGFLTGYNASTGYDLASGLGSVDVQNLISNWASVKLAATSTSLKLNNSTAAYTGTHGASVTFSVGVDPTSATGVVGIIDTANETANGPLNNGQFAIPLTSGVGTASSNGLPGGSYKVSARYGGDTANASSTSATINVDISAEPSTITQEVNAYDPQTLNPLSNTSIPYGSEVILDASITGTAEGQNTTGVATGTVAFKNGSTSVGTANVSSENLATYPPLSNSGFVAFAPGTYNLTASYSGDASYAASSTSTGGSFTIAKAATITAASASPTTVASGGSTTVTATITSYANDGNTPTGSVALVLGSTTLATLNNLSTSFAQSGNTVEAVTTASGSISASQLAAGSNSIKATYSGDANYATSSITFTVTGPSGTSGNPTISLTNSGNISVTAGATTGNTSTITVTPGGGFTGSVTLTCAVTTSMTSPNDPPTCSVASPVTISGTTAATAALTVATTATTTSALSSPLNKFFLGGGATLALVFFFGVPGRRRAWRTALSVTALCVVALIAIAGTTGCGGSNGGGGGGGKTIPGTTTGTYTVTVTGADAATGKVTSNTAVTLTVN